MNKENIFKISVLFLLSGILIAIIYFGAGGKSDGQHYVKYSDSGQQPSILDQKNGIIYVHFKDENYYSYDYVNGKTTLLPLSPL